MQYKICAEGQEGRREAPEGRLVAENRQFSFEKRGDQGRAGDVWLRRHQIGGNFSFFIIKKIVYFTNFVPKDTHHFLFFFGGASK